MTTPVERQVLANGLWHHVVEWPANGPTVLLAHGFLDLAWSWKRVAERLQTAGYRCIAWDWRGHGETEHIGAGGYYHFADYALDLDALWEPLTQRRDREDAPVHLVGHSMGGSAVAMYASARPDRMETLALVEGLGPPDQPIDRSAEHLRIFLDGVARARTKETRAMSLDEAVDRMRRQNPSLDDTWGRFLAQKSTRELPGGGRGWTFDPLHRTTSPRVFQKDVFEQYLRRIRAPTLVVAAQKGYRLGDEAERIACLQKSHFVEIPASGHMVQWEAPDALAKHLADHFAHAAPPCQ